MHVKETLEKVIAGLPEERLQEVLDFAMFLSWQEQQEGWRHFAKSQFGRAYGPNEPEYTLADIKTESKQ
jgi:hypothetical protein